MPTIDPYPPIPGLPPLPYSPLSLPTNNIATGAQGTAQGGMGSTPPPPTAANTNWLAGPNMSSPYNFNYPQPQTGGLGASPNATYSASEQNRTQQFTYNTSNLPGSQPGLTYNANNLPSYNHNLASNEAQQGVQQYQNSERGGPAPQTQYQQSERASTPTLGRNSAGQPAKTYVSPEEASKSINPETGLPYTDADYQAMGYVKSPNGGYTLPAGGTPKPTYNPGNGYYQVSAHNTLYFQTAQAYETYMRRKKLQAKKEAENQKTVNASTFINSVMGTG